MKRDLVLALGLFALSFWYYLGYVDTTEFHRDEARWVGRAYFIDEFFNPDSETWEDGDLTRGQPPLGSYLMGIGLTVQGRDTTTTRDRQLYDFTHSESWNRVRGLIPSQADIDAGRRTNSFVGALTVAFVYLIGRRMVNRAAGLAAALILLPHPLQVYLSSLAGSDALLALLVVLAGLIAIRFAERPTWWRAVLLGIVLGLGAATKLSPLVTAGLVAAYGVVLLLNGQPWQLRTAEARRRMEQGWMLLTVPFVAFATLVATYPYLWRAPIQHTINLFTFRTDEMENQGEIWTDRQVLGIPDALSRVKFHLGEQLTTMNWLAPQIEERFGIEIQASWLDLAVGTVGVGIWLLLAVAFGLKSKISYGALVIIGQAAVTIVGMQADFERYYLPILIALCLGAGVLIGETLAVVSPVWSWAVERTRQVRPLRARRAQPTALPSTSRTPLPAVPPTAPTVATSADVSAPLPTGRVAHSRSEPPALSGTTLAAVSGGSNGPSHRANGKRAVRMLAGGILLAIAAAGTQTRVMVRRMGTGGSS